MATTGFIKLTWKCAFVIGITLLLGHSYAQVSSTRDLHSWATALHTITLNQAVDSDIIANNYGRATAQLQTATLDIPLQGTLSSLAVSGEIQLRGQRSLVRVIMTDDKLNDYLVYEAYPLITSGVLPKGGITSIRSGCQETCVLPGVRPTTLRIELVSASITISALDVTSPSATASTPTAVASKRKEIQAAQEKEIVATLNQQIRAAGLKWVAGPTPISRLSYAEKKKLFRDQIVPNLQGFEYYKGGIFELPSGIDFAPLASPQTGSALVPAFDWRARHGANNPNSSYYDGDPKGSGWITSIKRQLCSDCWAHAANGVVEAGINLYFNQHLDMDLSEQQLVSCSGAGSCAHGGNPGSALAYIANTGIVDEACFPETGMDDPCANMCVAPKQTMLIGGYQDIVPSDGTDNIKQHLISEGPLVFGIISWWHTMVLVGYDTDPVDSSPIWTLKNSWGEGWGTNGYGSLKVDVSDMYLISNLLPPFTSRLTQYTIACRDDDHDGYFNWGTSTQKPTSCPANSPAINDCDDSNPGLALQQADGSCVGAPSVIGKVSPTSLSFAAQIINTTSTAKLIRLDNTGSAQMTVSAFQLTGDYAIQTNYCTNGVKPGTHCDIYMTFTPTAIGTRVGALTIVSNAVNSPQVVNLTGTGIAGGAVGAVSPTSLTFPSQLINTTSATQHVRLSNTGTAQMTVSSFQLSGDYAIKTNYCTSGVKPATGCDMYLTFTPKGAGTRAGKLSIVSNASNSPQTVNLSGLGTMVSLSPTKITFPTRVLNTTSTAKSVTMSNKGTTTLTISSISISGNFAIPSKTCGTSLAAATSCKINVNFKPTVTGTRTGSLSIAHNGGGSPTVVSLTGTGTAVTLTPTSLAFGSIVVGVTSTAKVVTMKNYGATALSITATSISGDFVVSAKSCSTSLAPSATCLYSIRFKPSIKGARTGVFSVSHNGGSSPSKVALGGTGL